MFATYRHTLLYRVGLLIVLLLLLIMITLLSIRTGAVEISTDRILNVLADRAGFETELDLSDRLVRRDANLILDIRVPRVVVAALIGAGLALSGAGLQGVFRNPLVEPGLMGVSSGAAVGAVTAILLDGSSQLQATAAFAGGLAMTLLVYRLAYRTDSSTLLLTGVAINAIAAAYVGMATFVGGQGQVGDITFWTLGSLAGIDWADVRIMSPFVFAGAIGLPLLAKSLNLMSLGGAEARHLGVNVAQLRLIVILLAALMTGVSVAYAGIIGFVGLVVPHLIRVLVGPDHRILLPASALGGAIFLISFDLIARTIAVPTEVPLGVLTTLIGGPVFLTLILLRGRKQ